MSWRKHLVTLLVGGLVAAACGGEAGSEGSPQKDAPTTTQVFLFRSDFEHVCNGATVSQAAPYVPTEPGPHPLMVFAGAAPNYGQQFVLVPDDWETEIGDEEMTQLVVCLDRTSQTSVELCEGYEDEGTTWAIETFDATYDVRLLTATTGEELAATTMSAAAGDCPFFSFYDEDDPDPKPDYATPEDDLVAFLAEFVNG